MTVPYATATSGERAREEIRKLLQRFGCESVGFMDEFTEQRLLLVFQWHGQRVQLQASARGWADLYLREIRGTTAVGAPRTSGVTRRSNRAWWR